MVFPRIVGVGCDVQTAHEVRHAWRQHGPRYLNAVLAESERGSAPLTVEELTQRFALKEAVAKALSVRADEPLSWTWIAVNQRLADGPAGWDVRAGAQQWSVDVTGGALSSARRQGIDQWVAWSWWSSEGNPARGYATVVALTGAKS